MTATVREALRAGIDRSVLLGDATAWARDGSNADAPAIALAWTRGLLLPAWTSASHGPAWRAAIHSDPALHRLVAPLLALGLLALPRDERSEALRAVPADIEAATRAAFLDIRQQERPAPAVVELAGGVWAALRRLAEVPVSDRTRLVSAALAVLGSVLAWELDVLADAPPVVVGIRDHADATALAAWWIAQIAEARP